jgi:hypothetical protein
MTNMWIGDDVSSEFEAFHLCPLMLPSPIYRSKVPVSIKIGTQLINTPELRSDVKCRYRKTLARAHVRLVLDVDHAERNSQVERMGGRLWTG